MGPEGLARLGGPERAGCLGSIFRSTIGDFGATLERNFTTEMPEEEATGKTVLIEQVLGTGTSLAILAPHGGKIEEGTDLQARRVYQHLTALGKSVRCWLCQGWKKDGGAWDCWHITSADINPDSFPKLGTMYPTKFQYAVAFHGWKEKHIGIGGGIISESTFPREHAAQEDLKREMRSGIEKALKAVGSDIAVCPADSDKEFAGSDPENIVNRITQWGNGIQIEQPEAARDKQNVRNAIATAVATVYQDRI